MPSVKKAGDVQGDYPEGKAAEKPAAEAEGGLSAVRRERGGFRPALIFRRDRHSHLWFARRKKIFGARAELWRANRACSGLPVDLLWEKRYFICERRKEGA